MIDRLMRWLEDRLPDRAGVAAVAIDETLQRRAADLPADEARLIAPAAPRRRREFLAGRVAARASLSVWGHTPRAILAHERGDPAWPAGVVGSISHTDRWAVAVTASGDDLAALGVDLEPDEPLAADLVALVCRPEEIGRGPEPGLWGLDAAKLRFVAKEAFYKAVFPRARRFVEFDEVTIDIQPGGTFEARFLGDVGASSAWRMPAKATGAFVHVGGLVCALCAWPTWPASARPGA
jgi:4'-phosphopantetheinyl transferase EntD